MAIAGLLLLLVIVLYSANFLTFYGMKLHKHGKAVSSSSHAFFKDAKGGLGPVAKGRAEGKLV